LSAVLSWSESIFLLPSANRTRCYDYPGLAAASDFFVVMDYDEQSQIFGACKAGANSPLPYLVSGKGSCCL
jgi:spore germination protein YaaH